MSEVWALDSGRDGLELKKFDLIEQLPEALALELGNSIPLSGLCEELIDIAVAKISHIEGKSVGTVLTKAGIPIKLDILGLLIKTSENTVHLRADHAMCDRAIRGLYAFQRKLIIGKYAADPTENSIKLIYARRNLPDETNQDTRKLRAELCVLTLEILKEHNAEQRRVANMLQSLCDRIR